MWHGKDCTFLCSAVIFVHSSDANDVTCVKGVVCVLRADSVIPTETVCSRQWRIDLKLAAGQFWWTCLSDPQSALPRLCSERLLIPVITLVCCLLRRCSFIVFPSGISLVTGLFWDDIDSIFVFPLQYHLKCSSFLTSKCTHIPCVYDKCIKYAVGVTVVFHVVDIPVLYSSYYRYFPSAWPCKN